MLDNHITMIEREQIMDNPITLIDRESKLWTAILH